MQSNTRYLFEYGAHPNYEQYKLLVLHEAVYLVRPFQLHLWLLLYLPQSNSFMHTYIRIRIKFHLLAGVSSDWLATELA